MFCRPLIFINIIFTISLIISTHSKTVEDLPDHLKQEEPPEGVYAFMEAKDSEPPIVRPPPYKYIKENCIDDPNPLKSANNFCGNLNSGKIPINPMNPEDQYPFKLIRDKTLEKIGHALPVLKNDDLPRVKEIVNEDLSTSHHVINDDIQNELKKRNDDISVLQANSPHSSNSNSVRMGKGCEGGGVLCYLSNIFQGSSNGQTTNNILHRRDEYHPHSSIPALTRFGDGPPTPCPAKIHYATPSYAKNYQGVWRYIVQIPYEGYYTQVVEVTYCLNKRSYHLEGYCLSTPRWERLLAAEKFYPSSMNRNQNNSDVSNNSTNSAECDGYDSHGCYQIRIFQDWFLVPSSCKVWKPDFYKRHAYQRN